MGKTNETALVSQQVAHRRPGLAIDQLRGIPAGPGGSDTGQGADPRGDVRVDVCAGVLAELAVCDEGALGSRESALPSSHAGS